MSLMVLVSKADYLITPARIRRWCAALLASQIALFMIFVLGTHGLLVSLDHPGTSDFVSFYAAGTLANGPHPELAYDQLAHYAAERTATRPDIPYFYFFYPPVFLLVCSLLARVPYIWAFLIFQIVTVAACLMMLRAIIAVPSRLWLLPVLSFAPVIWCMGFGQNSFLTAALFGGGTLLLHLRRPILAGLVLACLCYKPHTGLLIPIALMAGRSTRAVIATTFGVLLLIIVSIVAFGEAPWFSFLHALIRSRSDFTSGQISPFGYSANVYGALSMLGLSQTIAGPAQIVISILVAACVGRSWFIRRADGAGYALLISGTVLVMPVVLFYDIVLLLVASAWLYHAARITGDIPGERIGLASVWLMGLICYPMASAIHLPVACACATGIFALALARDYRSPIVHIFTKNKLCIGHNEVSGKAHLPADLPS